MPQDRSHAASHSRLRARLQLNDSPVTLAEASQLARGEVRAELDAAPAYRARLAASRRVLEQQIARGRPVYGVTTGVGASVENAIPDALQREMPLRLVRFHGCGTGRILDEVEAAAVVAVRLISLAKGYSGVRAEVLELLCELLNRRVLPRIPAEGSVGASGDLTPLSYLAALTLGEREATHEGRVLSASEALAAAGLAPLQLEPKESLALMNGTAVMTALAALSIEAGWRIARLAATVTAFASSASLGNPDHFDARIFALKAHPGTQRAAAWIREDLAGAPGERPEPARLQDRYSIRCAPHVIGVLVDALEMAGSMVETELNGIDDNPIADPDAGRMLHGGNFYGGHVAFAMDGLKCALANVADLLDRQLALLCVPETSGGLPANLVARRGTGRVVEHGFKAMQISASALSAEALKLTLPASVFSRSTESHNQDKVSMGTIAARDCGRVIELCENVGAIGLLAGCQAVELRGTAKPPALERVRERLRKSVASLLEDRRQDLDIARVVSLLRDEALALGPTAISMSAEN